jgi:hypothetical protein
MRDPDLVVRAQRAAAALEHAWDRWRSMHGLGAEPLPPISSYVGYSLEEPGGQPRVLFGVAAAEAEQLAAFLDRHDCAGPVYAGLAALPGGQQQAAQFGARDRLGGGRVHVPAQGPASSERRQPDGQQHDGQQHDRQQPDGQHAQPPGPLEAAEFFEAASRIGRPDEDSPQITAGEDAPVFRAARKAQTARQARAAAKARAAEPPAAESAGAREMQAAGEALARAAHARPAEPETAAGQPAAGAGADPEGFASLAPRWNPGQAAGQPASSVPAGEAGEAGPAAGEPYQQYPAKGSRISRGHSLPRLARGKRAAGPQDQDLAAPPAAEPPSVPVRTPDNSDRKSLAAMAAEAARWASAEHPSEPAAEDTAV